MQIQLLKTIQARRIVNPVHVKLEREALAHVDVAKNRVHAHNPLAGYVINAAPHRVVPLDAHTNCRQFRVAEPERGLHVAVIINRVRI